MKRFVAMVMVAVVSLSVFSCAQVVVRAPADRRIILSSGGAERVDREKRVFYALWGLAPLGDNSTVDLLKDLPNGTEVVISTETTFADALISVLLNPLTITTRSIRVTIVREGGEAGR